jgi:hypothetical protein
VRVATDCIGEVFCERLFPDPIPGIIKTGSKPDYIPQQVEYQHINRTNVLDKMIKYGMIIDILRMNLLRMD